MSLELNPSSLDTQSPGDTLVPKEGMGFVEKAYYIKEVAEKEGFIWREENKSYGSSFTILAPGSDNSLEPQVISSHLIYCPGVVVEDHPLREVLDNNYWRIQVTSVSTDLQKKFFDYRVRWNDTTEIMAMLNRIKDQEAFQVELILAYPNEVALALELDNLHKASYQMNEGKDADLESDLLLTLNQVHMEVVKSMSPSYSRTHLRSPSTRDAYPSIAPYAVGSRVMGYAVLPPQHWQSLQYAKSRWLEIAKERLKESKWNLTSRFKYDGEAFLITLLSPEQECAVSKELILDMGTLNLGVSLYLMPSLQGNGEYELSIESGPFHRVTVRN